MPQYNPWVTNWALRDVVILSVVWPKIHVTWNIYFDDNMSDDQAVCGWGPYVDQAAGDRIVA